MILVPYDGSEPAQQAVEHAIEHQDDEDLVLLRVVEIASGGLAAGIDIIEERLKEKEREAGELSKELRTLLHEEDVEFRTETAVGKPAREIVSFAEEHDVDRIIMGSHGREGVSRVLLGSVAEKVVRRAPTTVTVVR